MNKQNYHHSEWITVVKSYFLFFTRAATNSAATVTKVLLWLCDSCFDHCCQATNSIKKCSEQNFRRKSENNIP